MKPIHLTKFVIRPVCLILLLSLVPGKVSAWGAEGHRIVARIAATHLTDKTKLKIAALIKADKEDLGHCKQLGALDDQLACVATWADQVRNTEKYKSTAGFHFVNIPIFVPVAQRHYATKYCKQGCVVTALASNRKTLMTSKVAAKRAIALKFIVHFIGDLHQPLHDAVDKDHDFGNPENTAGNHQKLTTDPNNDRGGNSKFVVWLNQTSNQFGCWNLHAVWDEGIIEDKNSSDTSYAGELNTGLDLATLKKGTVVNWVNEALGLAVTNAYGMLPAPDTGDKVCEVPKGNKKECDEYTPTVCQKSEVHYRYKLEQSYNAANLPVVETQLQRAGVRLAQFLNQVFDPAGTMP
jgi:hypothetical protein